MAAKLISDWCIMQDSALMSKLEAKFAEGDCLLAVHFLMRLSRNWKFSRLDQKHSGNKLNRHINLNLSDELRLALKITEAICK